MEFSGMDLTAVQKAASDLKTQGNKTSVLRDEIDKLIKSMEDLWVGADAKDFVYSRWPKESRKMTTLGEKLLGLADKLTRQINDQVATSSATSLDGGNESWFFGMRNAPDYGENDKGEAYKAEAVPPETPIDASAITLESVNQGSFGDCYFLAALAGLAESDPEFLANNMQLNPDGTYTVRFYRANPETGNIEPVDITIDPVVSSGGAGDASGNPNWVSIYEAAYAKYLDGSQVDYDDLDGPLNLGGLPRTPYLALTGANPEVGYPGIDGLTEMLKNG
ncbi:MAG: hypothetical protein LBR19_05735, partial [Bifidobacteriaceae bacterium]|nr:hypothetical protein [Bifidobacteriaceae bacterium]